MDSLGVIDKCKPQHNETIVSLQYCKLAREQNENAKEWIGHLGKKLNEYGYKKRGLRQKEHIINGISDDDVMTEIIWELSALKKTWSH